MPFHYDEDKKKKRRVVETDPAKKAWKALQSGGLDPAPFDDFNVYEAKKHIKGEVKGMGPEGKRFLKDKLSGKKYKGKLKPKYKKDLLEELEGMSSKGKGFLKSKLGYKKEKGDAFPQFVQKELGDSEVYDSKSAAKWAKDQLSKPMSEKDDCPEEGGMDKKSVLGAVKDIGFSLGKGMSDKNMKSYVKKEKGDSKSDKVKALEALKKLELLGDKVNIQDSKLPIDKKMKSYVKKEKGDSKNWIKDAVKKPGALRETAKRMKLIKGDELLSSKDLDVLKSKAKKSGNSLLMRRVNLAETFKKMKK